MKTGTTYLQNILHANAPTLGEAGWAVPSQGRVVRAVRQVMALTDEGPSTEPLWDQLMDEARQHEGVGTLLSMEFLSFARRPRLKRLLESSRGLDLRVVVTVRDAARALPSQWQSLSRNGGTTSWPDFAEAVRADVTRQGGPGVKAFRRTQDLPRIIDGWSRGVPRERFTAVTVPSSSQPRELLWQRFMTAVGVDPSITTTAAAFDNPQLGYGSCDLLRRLNAAGLGSAKPSDYRRVVRRLSRDHLLPLREEQTRPALDLSTAEFAAGLNRATGAAIRAHTTLVGDLADLPTVVAPGVRHDEGRRPRQVSEAEVMHAARVLHAGALTYCREEGLETPTKLTGDLDAHLDTAVGHLAALVAIAIRGDDSHRSTRRSGSPR